MSKPSYIDKIKGMINQAMGTNNVKKVATTQVPELMEAGAFIMDVREPNEYAQGHVKGAHNIPMSQFQERLDEIPKDQPVYLHCASGQRSQRVAQALGKQGYENVHNIAGSFGAIAKEEFYNEKTGQQESVVTQ